MAAIDFEAGTVTKRTSANPLTEVPRPGEDLFLSMYIGAKGIDLRAVNGATLSECGPQ